MPEIFPIIDVPPDAPQATEAMGTKRKFWYRDHSLGWSLFKQPRQGTGEDWAEKIAAELAELLGLPHARYELAVWRGHRGTVCPAFLPKGGVLLHGNEILPMFVGDYPASAPGSGKCYRISQHTLHAVFEAINPYLTFPPIGWSGIEGVSGAADVFTGYLLLDAWIGNTDRHHENWGWIALSSSATYEYDVFHLAPTYDHASSMGRNETDERRKARLTSKDRGFSIQKYVERCDSALYATSGDAKPLSTLEAFGEAARRYSVAARVWLERLARVPLDDVPGLFNRVPQDRISRVAIEFAVKLLELNRTRLLGLVDSLP